MSDIVIAGYEALLAEIALRVFGDKMPGHHLPDGYLAQTIDRDRVNTAQSPLSTGQLFMHLIRLEEGMTISTAEATSGTTAAVAPTNQWMAIYKQDRTLVAQTVDRTTDAWAASSAHVFTFAAPVVIDETADYYLGLMVAAATVPNLRGAASLDTTTAARAPKPIVYAGSGLGAVAANPCGALVTAVAPVYFLVG